MVRVNFLVEGSQGDEYNVTFEFVGSIARAFCTCQAGTNGNFCKHRAALLDGDITRLRSTNTEDITRLSSLVQGTNLEAAYMQVVIATKTYDEAKKVLDVAKKRLTKIAYQ